MLSLLRELYGDHDDHHHGAYNGLLDNYLDSSSSPHVHFYVARPRQQSGLSSGNDSKGSTSMFQVMLNVKHFRPDEIEVKTVDDCVVIHGKHEEHADQHGLVSREFTRRYQLPDDVEPATVSSSLSRDGILTIQAPRKQLLPPSNERVIPITVQRPAAVEEAQKQQELHEQQKLQEQQAAQEKSSDQ